MASWFLQKIASITGFFRNREHENKTKQDIAELRSNIASYEVGKMTNLRDLYQDLDIPKTKIALVGPTGGGKSSYVAMLEWLLKGKTTVATQFDGQEGSMIFEEYFSANNFSLYDTRGFHSINNVKEELKALLNGQIQPGDLIVRQEDIDAGVHDATAVPKYDPDYQPPLAEKIHGLIFVVNIKDPRAKQAYAKDIQEHFKEFCRKEAKVEPVCVFLCNDEPTTANEEQIGLLSRLTGSLGTPDERTFIIKNYMEKGKNALKDMDLETQLHVLQSLDTALLAAERCIKLNKGG